MMSQGSVNFHAKEIFVRTSKYKQAGSLFSYMLFSKLFSFFFFYEQYLITLTQLTLKDKQHIFTLIFPG